MTVQTGSIRMGIATQSALGTNATEPTFLFGVSGGGIQSAAGQEPDDLTSGLRTSSSVFRSDVGNTATINGRAHLASIGAFLLGALGHCDSTDSSGVYTHVFTLADVLPYFTVFEEFSDGGTVVEMGDAKIDSLTFSWEGNKPLDVAVSLVGTEVVVGGAITPTVDETGLTTYFIPHGGTFKYDLDSATPATASVKGGSITITNGARAEHFSGAIEAGDVSEGWHVVECAFTIVPADITTWRTLLMGAADGTTIAASPVYGSFEHVFKSGTNSLKFEGLNVAFMCDLPEAAPGGGAAEVELAGMCMLPADQSANVKVTLVNATAGTVYWTHP